MAAQKLRKIEFNEYLLLAKLRRYQLAQRLESCRVLGDVHASLLIALGALLDQALLALQWALLPRACPRDQAQSSEASQTHTESRPLSECEEYV